MDTNTFIAWMKNTFGSAWTATYKANPASFQQMYYMQNNLSSSFTFEEFFAGLNAQLISELGVRMDNLSSTPQLVYSGAIYKTDNQIMKLATKINELVGISVDDARAVFANLLNDRRTQNQNPTFDKTFFADAIQAIMDHEEYVLDFELMEFKKVIGTDINGRPIHTTITHNVLSDTIIANENARALNDDVRPMAKELLTHIRYHNEKMKTEALAKIVNDFQYNPAHGDFFDKFAAQVHKVYNCVEDLDVFTVLLKQHYWQLKRRAMEKSVHNDIMLTFRGAQGIGKSFLMDALFGSVLGKFYNPSAKLNDMCDERWTPALGNMLMVNIDETDTGSIGKMGGKGMAAIKRIITNEIFTYRPMATNTTVEVRKKATFLSTSNFHIYEIMEDESGMRRFFEFNSRNEKQQRFDYAKVAQLKEYSMKAFQSIDENLDHGYWDVNSEVGKKITEVQDTYVNKSSLQDFIDNMLEYNSEMSFKDCISHELLYSEYVQYSKDQGIKENFLIAKKNFRRKMEDSLYDCTKMSSNVFKYKVSLKKPSSNVSFNQFQQPTAIDMINSIKEKSQIRLEIAEPAPISDDMSWAD